jgi:uncharacterized protein
MLQSSHQLNEPNGEGDYLPHVVCSSESKAYSFLLQELFEAGVSPNSRSAPSGATPVMLAAGYGKLDHLRVLLENGADPYARNAVGWGAVHYAARKDQVPILRALGKLEIESSRGVRWLLGSRSSTDCNVLHLAAGYTANTALRFIAEKGFIPDVNCQNGIGESPLHLAALNGNVETVEILISRGAKINAENEAGEHAVHYAARSGNESIVRALLRNGCSLAVDTVGLTPELVVLKYEKPKITSIFTELGLQQGMFVCSFNGTAVVEAVVLHNFIRNRFYRCASQET